MKKITLILFVLMIQSVFCQEIATTESGKRVLLSKNGTYKVLTNEKKREPGFSKSDVVILQDQVKNKPGNYLVMNGDEQYIDCKVSFSCTLNRYSTVNIEGLNSMISTANLKAMFAMKNRRTYVPKNVFVFFSDESSEWIIKIEYIAQNDYGATKDGYVFVNFDELGEFKSIISI